MEYLDTYTENHEFIGPVARNIVHQDALWHDTVHCWLYDNEGNIYFQIRADKNKLYTTASGHVQAGETIKEAFGREINEEIGYNVDYQSAELIEINKFVLDREEKDGTMFRDRAFANVYACIFNDDILKLNFDESELSGIVKINAKETNKLMNGNIFSIKGTRLYKENNELKIADTKLTTDAFLVNNGETITGKYGKVLEFIINKF